MKLINSIVKPYITGLHLGTYTYIFSNILDHTVSRDTTMEAIKTNPQLYVNSTVANFINLMGISPIYYIIVDNVILKDKSLYIQTLKILLLQLPIIF